MDNRQKHVNSRFQGEQQRNQHDFDSELTEGYCRPVKLTSSLFLLSTRREWVCQPKKVGGGGGMAPLVPTPMPMLTILDYHRPIDVNFFKACYPWNVLDLHVGEIHVVPYYSQFYSVILFLLFCTPSTQKSSVGMYSGCDYPYFILQTVYTCFCSFSIALSVSTT